MNSKNNHETNDQSVIIQDLDAQKTEEIKGGPIYMIIDGVDGDVTDARTNSARGGGGGAGKVQMQDFHFVAK